MPTVTVRNISTIDSRGQGHRCSAAPQRRRTATLRNSHGDSPVQERTSQNDNHNQALIKLAVDHLIRQLEAGHSDMLAAYLRTMARFHNYSFGNILQIARQCPSATRVAGFGKWKELGRFVKRGEKGIQILAPVTSFRRKKHDGELETESKPQRIVIGFRPVYVFDYQQTEGAELPELDHTITGDVGRNRDRLIEFLAQQNIALEFDESIAPALGVSYGGRIGLLPGQSQAEEFITLVHEMAHELLHRSERRHFTTKVVRETEAEAAAFIVGEAVGLKMGTASSDYIQLYQGNALLLAESLEIVQQAASTFLRALHVKDTNFAGGDDVEVA